jgi:hemerythrin-like domain-containing protein
MKRHPALRALSVDHHHGLVQSRRLLRANSHDSQDATGSGKRKVAQSFLRFFAEHTSRHFREEEAVLLPALARYDDLSDPSLAQMLLEHAQIRRLVADLQQQIASGEPTVGTMLAIGSLLQSHIRLEENTIFPLIERVMPEEALASLAEELGAVTNP